MRAIIYDMCYTIVMACSMLSAKSHMLKSRLGMHIYTMPGPFYTLYASLCTGCAIYSVLNVIYLDPENDMT